VERAYFVSIINLPVFVKVAGAVRFVFIIIEKVDATNAKELSILLGEFQ